MSEALSEEPMPVGISSFEKLVTSGYYYVDKTLLVRDVLQDAAEAILFCRPRRFGKTLNLDMLRRFFEVLPERRDVASLFSGMRVAACGDDVLCHQGRHPVVWLTFKDVKYPTWEGALGSIAQLVAAECGRHDYLADSAACKPGDRELFRRMLQADVDVVPQALLVLTRMLAAHHGAPCVVLVDEYDTPVNEALHRGYYDQAIDFMRVFLSGGLKDNPALFHGYLTGILRVAKEGIFSGLNNLKVDTVLDRKFAPYFGFTHEDVRTMCDAYGAGNKYEELCDWYDGYRFGDREVFNPWSVINYFSYDQTARPYWVSTSSNSVIADVLAHATSDVERDLGSLLEGGSVAVRVSVDAVYPRMLDDKSTAFSLLLMSGYLTVAEGSEANDFGRYRLRLPNRELALVYQSEVIDSMSRYVPRGLAFDFQDALLDGDAEALQRALERLLLRSASYFDTASEAFYQGLTLGLVATVDGRYRVLSNRESGHGRFDIALVPTDAGRGLPGVVIELKAAGKDVDEDGLRALAVAALEQVRCREYDVELQAGGVGDVLAYGVAFGGKRACVEVGSADAGEGA